MLGYHYTSKKAWGRIQHYGLRPGTFDEWEEFSKIVPELPKKVIWLWKEPLSDKDAWLVTAQLAIAHKTFEIVLLEVEYGHDIAGSFKYNPYNHHIINFKCYFSLNETRTPSLPIELLTEPVGPENIEIIWETDLLSAVYGRHPKEKSCVIQN